jgi:hypothetical protein
MLTVRAILAYTQNNKSYLSSNRQAVPIDASGANSTSYKVINILNTFEIF